MHITFKKAAGIVHLWLGLVAGLVIFIVAITGAIYVFSDDIIQLTEASFRTVKVEDKPQLSASQLVAIAHEERARFLGDKKVPEWNWQSLYRYGANDQAAEFSSRHYKDPDQYVDIFINPYNGKVIYTRDTYAYPFWDIVVNLHTSLLLGDFGTYVVEFSTLFLLVMLITGMILWFPKSRKGLKQRFTIKWKPTFKWKRKNYDLHNILGFYASWIVLFMIITGLAWSFTWVEDAIYFMLRSRHTSTEITVKNEPNAKADSSAIDRIYQQVKAVDAKGYCYNLNLAKDALQPFEVYVRQTRNWAPGNTYDFNPVTGALLSSKPYAGLSAGEKYDLLSGDIHYGWVFGWPSKIATFFACLVVASLPVTGFLIWWGRKKKMR